MQHGIAVAGFAPQGAKAKRAKGTKMGNWRSLLRADATAWLLGEDNPSIRYLTLKNILDRREDDRDLRRAKHAIMQEGAVPQILEKQNDGRWNSLERFYLDKYRGAVWQLIILAEHEASGEDDRIRAACEYILRYSQDSESGGFSVKGTSAGGRHSEVVPCLTGNMIWSLAKLGYLHDERIQRAIRWVTTYQRFDDGDAVAPRGWPYDRYEMCWGTHSCHMGVVKSLKALSALPAAGRSQAATQAIRSGCEYVLRHHIYKKSHALEKVSKPGWLKLQFPLMYQTDVLEVAGILLDLGVKDGRMDDAMELIARKQDESGRWALEGTFNGRFQVDIECKGKPSKWITLRAMQAMKKYDG
jgi:hypothetical protein